MPADSKGCPACGTAAPPADITIPAEMIEGLLGEARLLHTRGQHEEAINLCTRIMRLNPHSAAAHSLLARIYRETGNDREALGFYKLAVELDPANEDDKKALEAMIDRVFRTAVSSETLAPRTPVRPRTSAPRPAPARDVLKRFLLNLQPVPVVVGTTILFLCLAFFVLFRSPASPPASPAARDNKAPAASAPTGVVTPVASAPATTTSAPAEPRFTPPPPDAVEGGESRPLPETVVTSPKDASTPAPVSAAPATDGAPAVAPAKTVSTQVPPFQPAVADTMPSLEEMNTRVVALKAALERTLKASPLPSTLTDIRLDPRTNALTLEFSIPRMGSASETKQALLYTGFHLIWAAHEQDKALTSYTLRGAAALAENETPALALVADVTPRQATSARAATDYQTVAGFLSSPWWRKELAAASF